MRKIVSAALAAFVAVGLAACTDPPVSGDSLGVSPSASASAEASASPAASVTPTTTAAPAARSNEPTEGCVVAQALPQNMPVWDLTKGVSPFYYFEDATRRLQIISPAAGVPTHSNVCVRVVNGSASDAPYTWQGGTVVMVPAAISQWVKSHGDADPYVLLMQAYARANGTPADKADCHAGLLLRKFKTDGKYSVQEADAQVANAANAQVQAGYQTGACK